MLLHSALIWAGQDDVSMINAVPPLLAGRVLSSCRVAGQVVDAPPRVGRGGLPGGRHEPGGPPPPG